MARIELTPEAERTPEEQAVCEEATSGLRGRIPAPMTAWLRNPELARRGQRLGELLRYQTALEPRLSELAILVTARHWTSHYEWTVHKREGLKAGMDPEVIAAIAARRPPALRDEPERVVHEVSSALLATRRVPETLYRRGVAALGERGMVELVGILGYYGLVALTLNAFELGLPDAFAGARRGAGRRVLRPGGGLRRPAMWEPSQRYPDPAIRALDPSFGKYHLALAGVERLFTGCRWTKGPAWFGGGRYLLWSDVPNDRILRWDEATGAVGSFRAPSNHANGNTRDREGRLVTCEHGGEQGGRRVTCTEHNGAITVLLDHFEGKRLNSPNDVVVKSDGSIWFTDPPFGIAGYYQGVAAEQELPARVYRIDGATGRATVVADDVAGPNGLAFSPDESRLYLIESHAHPRAIRVFDVDGEELRNSRVLLEAGPGTPDGFRVDVDGNLWCGWGMGAPELDGVRVFNPAGDPIGHITLPERCANLCFGGRHRNRLFMAASHSLYALYVNTRGAPGG
jgi:gluconolactonase